MGLPPCWMWIQHLDNPSKSLYKTPIPTFADVHFSAEKQNPFLTARKVYCPSITPRNRSIKSGFLRLPTSIFLRLPLTTGSQPMCVCTQKALLDKKSRSLPHNCRQKGKKISAKTLSSPFSFSNKQATLSTASPILNKNPIFQQKSVSTRFHFLGPTPN